MSRENCVSLHFYDCNAQPRSAACNFVIHRANACSNVSQPSFQAIPTSKMDEMQTFVMSAAGLARSMFRVNWKLCDLGLSFIVMSRKPSSIFSSSSPRQPLGSARQCRNPVICVQTFSTIWPRVESMVHRPPSSAQMGREPFQQSLQDSDILSKEAQLGRRPVSPSHEEQLCKSILASLLPYDQQA